MSAVKRYDPINSDGTYSICVEDSDYGAYVEYADYAALAAECAALRNRAKVAECEAHQALKTLKGLEKVARVVSNNSDQVCGELNIMTQQHNAALAECERLRADAERYRWLRDSEQLEPDQFGALNEWLWGDGDFTYVASAIDAALSANP